MEILTGKCGRRDVIQEAAAGGEIHGGTFQAILVLVDDPNRSVVVVKIFAERAAGSAEQGLHVKMRDDVIIDFEQQLPPVSLGHQLSLIRVRSVAGHCTLESCGDVRSDGFHKSDLIGSHFTLFAPSETQDTELSSWRGNWNHVRTAQLRVAGLRSCFGKM